MTNCLRYKDYTGCFEYYDDEEIFYGNVLGIDDVVTFQGRSVQEIKKSFRDSVDEYLEFCKKIPKEPDKPYSGKFTVRLSPELHRKVDLLAKIAGKSLNEWVREQLEEKTVKAG